MRFSRAQAAGQEASRPSVSALVMRMSFCRKLSKAMTPRKSIRSMSLNRSRSCPASRRKSSAYLI